MERASVKSVSEYIATHPKRVQAVLRRVRSTIRKAVPGAQEGISYRIAAYKLHGEVVIYFAGFKEHYSLFPATGGLVEALGDEVARHVVSKGTIRFSLAEPVPVRLITRIAKFRASQAAERAKARRKKGKKGQRQVLGVTVKGRPSA